VSLPQVVSKYGKKAFIEPPVFLDYVKKLGRLPKYEIPKNIVFYFIPTQLPKFKTSKNVESKKFFNARMDILKSENVGVVSQFGFGAPALAIQLELLIAMGAKNFIGVGTSGSLLADVRIGDLVLCNKAIRDEGVSYHYVPPSEFAYPSEILSKKIRKTMMGMDVGFHEGPTWTTDAIYRETLDEVHKCRTLGVYTVDMEASALFTVARYRNVNAASLFAISDLLTGEEWAPHMHKTAAPLGALLDIAIKSLAR
jgi:uridine phosphorylase